MNKRELHIFLAVFLLFVAPITPSAGAQSQPAHHYLEDALDNKLVQVALCGIGASSGMAIVMAIKSLVSHELHVDVQSGTVLRSKDPAAQDMAVT